MSTPYREDQDEVLRWEYKVVVLEYGTLSGKVDPQKLEASLNALGAEGWELVLGTLPGNFPYAMTFKRPLP
jgi:hypothetical protein